MRYAIVTGGAGFIGSNLIEKLLFKNKKIKILSLDNYSSGSIKNHIKSNRVKYIRGDTRNFEKIFKKYKKKVDVIFHFGEFSRIAQSFVKTEDCLKTNIEGSYKVIKFCLDNNIKIIYSATSATLGDENNPHRSPYSYSKFNNLNLLINLNKWFGLKYSVVYFYNVYGGRQIQDGHFMSAVVGIFENQFLQNKKLTVVRPGSQKRNFTHVDDTIKCVLKLYKSTKNLHYAVYNKKFISILNLAKLFSSNIQMIKERPGERFESKTVNFYRGIRIKKYISSKSIKQYIYSLKKRK